MIEEALQGLASASGAHTISSAPKEGEDALLLYCPEQGGWHVGKWLAPRWVAAINAEHVLNPTHWMHVPASPVPKPWTRDEALKLFRMYEDKGWAVKQQMVSIVAWVTPIVFALLALSAKEYCAPWASETEKLLENLGPLASATASAIALFTWSLILGNLRHSDNDYRNADEVITRAKDLNLFPPHIQAIFDKQPGTPRALQLGLFRKIGTVYVMILIVYFVLIVIGGWLFFRPQTLDLVCKQRVDLESILEPLIGADF